MTDQREYRRQHRNQPHPDIVCKCVQCKKRFRPTRNSVYWARHRHGGLPRLCSRECSYASMRVYKDSTEREREKKRRYRARKKAAEEGQG